MRTDDFILQAIHKVPYYSCRAFESLPWVRHGFSTRLGGVSGMGKGSLNLKNAPWDSPDRVRENQRRFLSALSLEKACLLTLHQVHSNRVRILEELSGQWNPPEGDALITRVENAALAVKTADCMPVLIADPIAHAIGAVHSGWRGTLSGVLLHTIEEMQRAFGSDPADLLIAIGPGIRACCFEVGDDVVRLFDERYPESQIAQPIADHPGKYRMNLCNALDIQLDLAGVPLENRHDLGACTCCRTREFFSYRAEGLASGRMMAVIGIAPDTA